MGGQSPYGFRSPSLVARRVTGHRCALEAVVRFEPDTVHQSAGIAAYYNSRNWHYLALTADGLVLTTSDRGVRTEHHLGPAGPEARLRVEFDGPVVRFNHGPDLDATILSDEYADEFIDGQVRSFGFTGAFAGLWVQDLAGEGGQARFEEITWTSS